MPWKWDPTRPHDVHVTVTPASTDTSAVVIVWGDAAPQETTMPNSDAGKLLRELEKQVQQLGYALEG